MWERYKTTRIKLTREARDQIGAMLVVLRNEYVAGASTESDPSGGYVSEQQVGAAINFRKMIECIDRIISRIDTSFDITKLNQAYSILARAGLMSVDTQISTKSLDEATEHYGSLGFDYSRDRIADEGDDQLHDASGDIDRRLHARDSGGGSNDQKHEHSRPD